MQPTPLRVREILAFLKAGFSPSVFPIIDGGAADGQAVRRFTIVTSKQHQGCRLMNHPSQHWHTLRWPWLFALIIFLSSCGSWQGSGIQNQTIEVPKTIIPTPPGYYGRLAWVDDWVVMEISPPNDETAFSGRLWQLHPDGSQAAQLNLPLQEGCALQGVQSPARLPDNRLGYIVRCAPYTRSNFDDRHTIMAYDFQSGRSIPLRSYSLPSQQVGTGGYSWDPTMQRGITSDGNGRGLYEQLYWLNSDQPETLDVGLPQAFAATWAPDGSQIAYFGAPEQGLSGIGRADATFNLYLMAPDGTQSHIVLPGLHFVASLAWSPDAHWLLLPASLTADRNDEGVWLIERSTGNYRQIAQGDFATPAWSPDGQQVALLEYLGEYPNETVQLVILNVGTLVHSP